jgi:3-methyladenine DNA glycosylase AlkC
MAEPLKNFFSPPLVRRMAETFAAAWPAFPRAQFVREAARGLTDFELLARAEHIADALGRALPPSFEQAADIMTKSLGPEHRSDELEGAGMAPFFYLPHTMWVAKHGLDHFERSMVLQHELTRRFTCEFSIRAFLTRHPDATLRALYMFARDPNPHVRRLASEGTRPRLPWAARVPWISQEPRKLLPLLELLRDDPTTLVRRSVANHLNDIAKDHPDIVLEVAESWHDEVTQAASAASQAASHAERRTLLAHALRTLVKKGDPRALALLGFGGKPKVVLEGISVRPKLVKIGERIVLGFRVRSTGRTTQTLSIDLEVDFVKANGGTGTKVFKVAKCSLAPGAISALQKSISLAQHTTRKHYPGEHAARVLINGERRALGSFTVIQSAE